jgi:AbrB family looped-hinge helix DNA binding protein
METLSTTRMSSKGQIVIPEAIRKRLNLKEGAQFIVVGEGDVVVLKAITVPNMDSFDGLIKEARGQAKRAGLKREEIDRSVSKTRSLK